MNLSTSPTQKFQEDGFSITAAEPWFKVKVQLIQNYLESFVANAAGRVDDIVFVDLYSGSGFYSIGHQREIFAGSCLSSLSTNLPITKWIFCESDPEQGKALKIRVNKYFRNKNIVILDGHAEDLLDKFRTYIPQSKGGYKVATLCLVDPFSIDLSFSLLEKLASLGFSFLMPYVFCVNDRLNYDYYLNEKGDKVKKYLGGHTERLSEVQSNLQFYKHLVKIHQNNMLVLGLNTSLSVHKLDSGLMELPLYYIGFYSKQFSTKAVQHDVQMNSHVQFDLF